MSIEQRLNDKATLAFVADHQADDVRQLAFQADKHPDVDMPWALQQIAGRQAARRKLPSWAEIPGMVYPPHLAMEQCSSEQTAREKTLAMPWGEQGDLLIDLTGGFGVDFAFMARGFRRAVYVERQEDLCAIARHNFQRMGLEHAEVVCGDGVEFLHQRSERATAIYLDPARRDIHGAKTYAISDCTPDVVTLREELLKKADFIVLKLSPMLDWREAVRLLPAEYAEVRIVSVGNECKELLLILSDYASPHMRLVCINDEQRFAIDNLQGTIDNVQLTIDNVQLTADVNGELSIVNGELSIVNGELSIVNGYLYEPNASIMKAGCFGAMCQTFGVKAIAENSHLFVSPHFIETFPGRKFKISTISSMNKKALRQALQSISHANIAVRNFPLTAQQLRQRLRLKDGGEVYIFGTTTSAGNHMLLICTKAQQHSE